MVGLKLMRLATALSGAAMGLGACGDNAAPQQHAANAASNGGSTVTDAASQTRACLLAGAEAFEVLTEHASAAPLADLSAESRAAVLKAETCQSRLSTDWAFELSQINRRLGQFPANPDRVALALNAVEGYRVLVTALVREPTDAPLAVALLDYAGFRYQAGVSAPAPLWSEARSAIDFADEQWRAISSRVVDKQLSAAFAADLQAMRRAIELSDAPGAQRAATNELDRVDALEAHFSQHPGG